jgi:hypothetical protein
MLTVFGGLAGLFCTIVNRIRDGSFALPEADIDAEPGKVEVGGQYGVSPPLNCRIREKAEVI